MRLISRMGKKGCTIIELLMVIGIIGILMTIVTTAALGSLKTSRAQKADALCKAVEQGLATYYAQKDRWPGSIGTRIASGSFSSRSNDEGLDYQSDDNKYVLEASEIKDMIKEIVRESKNGNPMMDISGLYVSRDAGEANGKGYGMDFMDAIHGTKRSPKKMSLGEMNFGYQDPSTGYFRRFKVVYSIPTDEMKVSRQ